MEACISLAISDEILLATGMSAHEMRVEIALMLYQQEKLTLGQASAIAEMPQLRFQHLLAARDLEMHNPLANTLPPYSRQ